MSTKPASASRRRTRRKAEAQQQQPRYPSEPSRRSSLEAAAEAVAKSSGDAVVQRMLPLAGLASVQIGKLQNPVEIKVGPVSAVIVAGEIEGVRFGEGQIVELLSAEELMEIGSFLFGLGAVRHLRGVAKRGDGQFPWEAEIGDTAGASVGGAL